MPTYLPPSLKNYERLSIYLLNKILFPYESSYRNASINIYFGSINPYTIISLNGSCHIPYYPTSYPVSNACIAAFPFSIALTLLDAA
jgi:hypothetical protein